MPNPDPMAMSRAFHRTADFLVAQFSGLESDNRGDPEAVVGYGVSSVMLRAFAAELAIKAMHVKENNRDHPHGHDLESLFGKLKVSTQRSIETRFQRIQASRWSRTAVGRSLPAILSEHKGDFPDWRYLHEKENLHAEVLALNPVIEAIVEEYDSRP